MKSAIIHLIACMAPQYDLSPYTVSALVELESSWNPAAVGSVGEQGLLQLRPRYYRGPWNYADPRTNLELGLKTLKRAKRVCEFGVDKGFVVCHNRGVVGAKRLSTEQLENDEYLKKFRRIREAHKAQRLFEQVNCD